MPNYFGVKVLEGKRGLKLTREKYAVVSNKSSLPKFSVDIYADEEGSTYSNEWCTTFFIVSLAFFTLVFDGFINKCIPFLREAKNGFP